MKKIDRLVCTVDDVVSFLGAIETEDIGAFYSLIDILVLPSVNSTEAFGMVQVEAMMMGVPVIASDLPGVRVPIEKTGMGIVVPIKDAKAIAKAIDMIIINRKRYIKPKKQIINEFSHDETIQFYLRLIRTF